MRANGTQGRMGSQASAAVTTHRPASSSGGGPPAPHARWPHTGAGSPGPAQPAQRQASAGESRTPRTVTAEAPPTPSGELRCAARLVHAM